MYGHTHKFYGHTLKYTFTVLLVYSEVRLGHTFYVYISPVTVTAQSSLYCRLAVAEKEKGAEDPRTPYSSVPLPVVIRPVRPSPSQGNNRLHRRHQCSTITVGAPGRTRAGKRNSRWLCDGPKLSLQVSSYHSRWYSSAQKGPFALHPVFLAVSPRFPLKQYHW